MDARSPSTRSVDPPTVEGTEPTFGGEPYSSSPALRPGRRCGRYVVLRELGSGGMSVVYAAYDPELDRQVALKIMRPVPGSKTQTEQRLLREAQALARLAHPNVVHVYDVGTVDGQVYVAMELIEGRSLAEWVQAESPRWRAIVDLLFRAGQGLAAAHAAGLVHLDFKPTNVLIGDDGRVRVVDFGLARRPRSTESRELAAHELREDPSPLTPDPAGALDESGVSTSGRLDDRLTEAGVVAGTPGYMAPEQLALGPVDAHADQFAFCVTLYRCLFAELPFPKPQRAFLRAVRKGLPARRRGAPRFVMQVLRRGLALDPGDRFGSMEDLLRALSLRRHDQRRFVATALVTSGIGAAVVWPRADGVDCGLGHADLAKSWNDEVRAAINLRFAGTGISDPERTWTRTAQVLDRWAERWVSAHRDACEATHVRKEQSVALLDRRMLCLRRHRIRFDGVIDLLRSLDADLLEHVDAAIASLPPAEACAHDIDADAQELTEAQRADVLEAESLITRGNLSRITGRSQEGATTMRKALDLAERSGHLPSILEAKRIYGASLCALGRCDEGLAVLDEASFQAERSGRDLDRFLNYAEQVFLRAHDRGEIDRAQWYASAARSLAERLEVPASERIHLLAREAALADMAGQHGQALEIADLALSLRKAEGMPLDTQHARLVSYRGSALYHLGRYAESLSAYLEALEIEQAEVAPGSPALAGTHENVGNALRALGDLDGALTQAKKSVEILEAGERPRSPYMAHALLNLGGVLLEREDYGAALQVLARSETLAAESMAGTMLHGVCLLNLGEATLRTGDAQAAVSTLERAATSLQSTVGKDHAYLGAALATLGHARVAAGDPVAALDDLDRARTILGGEGVEPLAKVEADLAWGQAVYRAQPDRRALASATVAQARDELRALAPRGRVLLREAQAWLDAHPVP